MSKIIITCDSTVDLSKELIEKLDVKVIPMTVNMEGKEYKDGVTITPNDIYRSVDRTGELPRTAAINISEYIQFFEAIREDEDDIILNFTISSKLSSTFQSSYNAVGLLENVYTIDSYNLSTGIALLVMEACKLRDEGKDIQTIIQTIEELKLKVDASFMIDDLKYLAKGGRCSAMARYGANILAIKPCIDVQDGAMGVGKKYRGKFLKVLKNYISEKLENVDDLVTDHIFITHAGVDQEAIDLVYNDLKERNIFKNIYITQAGATISCHCGKNTLGILFVRKSNK